MRYAVDPRQKPLFDTAETMFSPVAIKYLEKDWPGLFRTQILHLMPVAGPAPQNTGELTVDDFVVDDRSETVECCPQGCVPISSTHDANTGRTRTVMKTSDCSACAFFHSARCERSEASSS